MERTGSIQLDIPDFSNSVLSHLNQLRIQGRLCDIVVNVQGQSFRAHKVVLAASSPYFRDHMALSEMSTVSLSVIRNPTVFEQLLSFCYTGRLCLKLADIISYLTAASFLQMQHIIDRCTQILEGIHFKISLADIEEELRGRRSTGRTIEAKRGGSLSPGHGVLRVLATHEGDARVMEVSKIREISPPGESMSPQIVEHSGLGPEAVGAVNEPILRINRAGQWYVEAGPDMERNRDETLHVVEGLRIKTERMEEWMGAETQASAEEGSGTEEGPTVMIDTSGRSTLVQDSIITGASRAKNFQPSSSFSESERLSPTGSILVMTERPRAKSESPGRVDDQRHPTSQGEETAVFDVGGYEEYLREQVGDRWFRYNPRLTCIYCCKSFNQKGSLDRHMRLHMGITPFVCRMCGKKYTRKDQLEYHIRKHTGNKPFHCHVCGKSFPFQAILNQHFRKNHPGCTPHEGSHSASPETTTNNNVNNTNASADTPRHTQHDVYDESEGTGTEARGGASSFGEGIQPSVSTTGPD